MSSFLRMPENTFTSLSKHPPQEKDATPLRSKDRRGRAPLPTVRGTRSPGPTAEPVPPPQVASLRLSPTDRLPGSGDGGGSAGGAKDRRGSHGSCEGREPAVGAPLPIVPPPQRITLRGTTFLVDRARRSRTEENAKKPWGRAHSERQRWSSRDA